MLPEQTNKYEHGIQCETKLFFVVFLVLKKKTFSKDKLLELEYILTKIDFSKFATNRRCIPNIHF